MSRNLGVLSRRQIRALIALSDPSDPRSQVEIAESVGCAPETLSRWKKIPAFGDLLRSLTTNALAAEAGRVSAVLLRAALQGDLRAVRLFFEIIGMLGHRRGFNQEQIEAESDAKREIDKLILELSATFGEDALRRASIQMGEEMGIAADLLVGKIPIMVDDECNASESVKAKVES